MIRLAIGPEQDTPSWNWVGFDTARELSKYFTIEVFRQELPPCDVALLIKRPIVADEARQNCKLIYFPIDYYDDALQIDRDHEFLRSCTAIGCHSESLIPYFSRYCDRTFFIEHHGRYTLRQMNTYKRDGVILWIGGMQHVPFLLKWLDKHPLSYPVRIMTNYSKISAFQSCKKLAEQLEMSLNVKGSLVNGHEMIEWTERAQWKMMQEAKAGLDIKGGSWLGRFHWQQYMKPPTKAQKFISSGIPLAMNDDSYSFDYFRRRKFVLVTPEKEEEWLSRAYWERTVQFAALLRKQITLEQIGLRLKQIVENLIARNVPDATPARGGPGLQAARDCQTLD